MKESKRNISKKNRNPVVQKRRTSGLRTNLQFFKSNQKVETSLDGLYEKLKKQDLKISTIMKKFDLEKEQALEWCEILTNKNLAEIRYPIFGEPLLRLKRE